MIYNSLYKEAKKLKVNGTVPSVTEGYKHALNAFLQSLDNNKLYKKSVIGIHHYFLAIGFGTISFQKCLDKLVGEFVPTDYFTSLSSQQKMGVLRMVLNQSLKMLIKKIVESHMSKIIDYHKEKDNARLLQDEFIDCLIMAREGMYQRFIKTQTKTNKNENINRALGEKMQTEIKKLTTEKYKYLQYINILKQAHAKQKDMYNKQSELVGDLNEKIVNLVKKIDASAESTAVPIVNTFTPSMSRVSPVDSRLVDSRPTEYTTTDRLREESIESGTSEHESTGVTEPDNNLFVEVTNDNINSIINGDDEYLQQMKDSDSFSVRMNRGITLDDFS
jgi:hypothetical protein